MVGASPTKKVIFEGRLEGGERLSLEVSWGSEPSRAGQVQRPWGESVYDTGGEEEPRGSAGGVRSESLLEGVWLLL